MKKFLRTWLTGAVLAIAFAQPAGAVLVTDNYVGADDQGYGDVISGANDDTFDIHSMDISLVGSTLTVTINTNYAGNAGHLNTTYGDLFLSSSWTPDGTAPYATDDASNGTLWEYGFALDGRTINDANKGLDSYDNTTQNTDYSGILYELNGTTNEDNALLSDYFTNNTYRNGQEVVVDTTNIENDPDWVAPTNVGTGTWSFIDDTSITFSFDLSGTDLLGTNIAVHWAMTCANDVIEGVPAPVILLLMATGLFGVGVSTAVKRKRA